MKPTKPGWYWLGVIGPEPEVVHVRKYCGELSYQRAGAIGEQQVSWTIDEIWGEEVLWINMEYRQCSCGKWNQIRSDERYYICQCGEEIEVPKKFERWPSWAISAMEAGFNPPDGWGPNEVTK